MLKLLESCHLSGDIPTAKAVDLVGIVAVTNEDDSALYTAFFDVLKKG